MSAEFGLVQIAPPGPGGVADHMDALAQTWLRMGIDSAQLRLQHSDVQTQPLADRLVAAAGDHAQLALLLHFSCYGYGRRGLCRWLVDALVDAKRALGERLVLITMFHELHAGGPPWRSAFWLGGLQAGIARDIAHACDIVWTNSAWHAQWLAGRTPPELPIHEAPVFSTVGEMPGVAPPSARAPTMVVFGGRATRERALAALAGRGSALAQLGVRELLEIGSGAPCDVPPGLPPCHHAGGLPAAQVNAALAAARFGLIDYPGHLLAKSSVFGAYAAAGCVVLNTRRSAEPADGLLPWAHYLLMQGLNPPTPKQLDGISAAARDWYTPHDLETQARGHLRLIRRQLAHCKEAA